MLTIVLACLITGFAVELYLLHDLNKRLESLEVLKSVVEDLYNDVYEDEEDVHNDYEE